MKAVQALPLEFNLPDNLECALPTEERGLRRDEVRLMVSYRDGFTIHHNQFFNLTDYLMPGDVLVVNTSGTQKAALDAESPDGRLLKIHFSTQPEPGKWIAEVRAVKGSKTVRWSEGRSGDTLYLSEGGSIRLERPYYQKGRKHLQLWYCVPQTPMEITRYLAHFGQPIQYQNLDKGYPIEYYQTVFTTKMGSSEMPSAGRAFTPEGITRLTANGIQIVPVLLHTGVSSLETEERPYEEYFEISQAAADRINAARRTGNRIIAVGTTAIRALETQTTKDGWVQAGKGWTDVFITPERGLYAVDGLLTGFHEPKASHLLMLEALANRPYLANAYEEAIKEGYYWHQFGDLHLILP